MPFFKRLPSFLKLSRSKTLLAILQFLLWSH